VQNGTSLDVVGEVYSGRELIKSETGRIEGHARNRQGGFSGFVENQLQRVAIQKVDAVEGRVLRRGGDLRQNLVVLGDEGRTGVLRHRVGHRRHDCAGSGTGGRDVGRVKRGRRGS